MRIPSLFFTILLFSCAAERSKEVIVPSLETKNYSKETCIDESCVKVNFTWPEFESSERGYNVNQAVQDQLVSYFYSDSVGSSLEEQSQSYLNSFLEAKADFPDMPGGWEMEVEAIVSFDSLSTLSIFFTEFNYSGGAHPNSSNYFMNFDRSTGEFLSIDRLVLDQPKLLALAEKAFREFHEVDEDLTLEESGLFFLPETGFFLPNAMGFSGDKFQLIYIPYEIGPYAMGFTELEFSLDELNGIVRF